MDRIYGCGGGKRKASVVPKTSDPHSFGGSSSTWPIIFIYSTSTINTWDLDRQRKPSDEFRNSGLIVTQLRQKWEENNIFLEVSCLCFSVLRLTIKKKKKYEFENLSGSINRPYSFASLKQSIYSLAICHFLLHVAVCFKFCFCFSKTLIISDSLTVS